MPILAIGPAKPGTNNVIAMGIGETIALPPGFSARDFAADVFKSTKGQRHSVKVGKYFGPDPVDAVKGAIEGHAPDFRK